MIIDLNQPILDFNNKPIQSNGQPTTFGDVFRQILGSPSDKDNAERRLKRYKLGMKCVEDEADLDIDERKLLKDLMDEFKFSPIVYGRICEVFEGSPESAKNGQKVEA